jgi:hypothetical protein
MILGTMFGNGRTCGRSSMGLATGLVHRGRAQSASCVLALSIGALLSVAASGCHGAGPYGYAPKYAPSAEEEKALGDTREYDPVMFAREPDSWRKSKVSLFGVVTSRTAGAGGAAYVTMTVRKLEPRNLCSNANDEETCRVTVSDRDFGIAHALLALKPEDDVGEHSLARGSLVRLVGSFGEDVDSEDGAPVMRASFYRHWPRYFYVTKSNAATMRQ